MYNSLVCRLAKHTLLPIISNKHRIIHYRLPYYSHKAQNQKRSSTAANLAICGGKTRIVLVECADVKAEYYLMKGKYR